MVERQARDPEAQIPVQVQIFLLKSDKNFIYYHIEVTLPAKDHTLFPLQIICNFSAVTEEGMAYSLSYPRYLQDLQTQVPLQKPGSLCIKHKCIDLMLQH